MTEADIPAVMAIENELFTDPWPETIFQADVSAEFSRLWVVEIEGEIAAYTVLGLGYREGHLNNIAVTQKYQRKNIAKKLLTFILEFCTGQDFERILLEVRPSNEAAISLYRSFGFYDLAVRRRYYRDPVEDCLVMEKILSSAGGV